jgi:hypothetical protein
MKKTNIDNLFNAAVADLTNDRDRLNELVKSQAGTEVGAFVIRALEWYADQEKHQLLWELLNEAVDMSKLGFMGSFRSFVGNCLLDDSSFRIEWRKLVQKGGDLEWDYKTGSFKTEVCNKEDPDARPTVLYAGDDGSQKVALLMEAMDHKVWEVEQREALEKHIQELFMNVSES